MTYNLSFFEMLVKSQCYLKLVAQFDNDAVELVVFFRNYFLPLYSPEYNPIECTWSTLKQNVSIYVHLYGPFHRLLMGGN